MPDDDTIRAWVAEARVDLADHLADLPAEEWEGPSLCAGWTVRDVVGHLVWLAEASRPSAFRDIARELRPPDAAMARIARRVGADDPAALVTRLRAAADGRFVAPTQGPIVGLGEVYVHGADALRPTGRSPRLAGDRIHPIAEAYRRLGVAFGSRGTAKVRFVADDAGWSVGPEDGPEARGPAEAVLLALAGRPAGGADLTGPGVDRLRR